MRTVIYRSAELAIKCSISYLNLSSIQFGAIILNSKNVKQNVIQIELQFPFQIKLIAYSSIALYFPFAIQPNNFIRHPHQYFFLQYGYDFNQLINIFN